METSSEASETPSRATLEKDGVDDKAMQDQGRKPEKVQKFDDEVSPPPCNDCETQLCA